MCTHMYTVGYHSIMQNGNNVGVREFRAGLSAFLRRAEAGDRITVTIDGRPIAQLTPLEPHGELALDDLVATGQVMKPKQENKALDPEAGLIPIDLSIDRILQELRGS